MSASSSSGSAAHIAVLGAGPAGLGAAVELAERGFEVTVLERADRVGGNAGSFELAGIPVDFGSHRLHPAADPAVLARLKSLLGDDLLVRPRRGRIHLGGRWIRFPLRPLDFLAHAPRSFVLGLTRDALRPRLLHRRDASAKIESFASVLEAGLGPTLARAFYFPFARKIWGCAPEELSPVQAHKRVSASSLGKMAARALGRGRAGVPKGVFYYPRRGYGQISEALAAAARERGARIELGADVRAVATEPQAGSPASIEFETADGARRLGVDRFLSTLPVTTLARALRPSAPEQVLRACADLRFRSLRLVYLVLDVTQFTEFDAHYFPGADVPFARVSEPKNYSGATEPRGRTVLCAELPCDTSDELWNATDEAAGELVADALAACGMPLPRAPIEVATRRLGHAYPVYALGFDRALSDVDAHVATRERVITYGRQGLFAHDNTHHALLMARRAAECCTLDGGFDHDAWDVARQSFEDHVVED